MKDDELILSLDAHAHNLANEINARIAMEGAVKAITDQAARIEALTAEVERKDAALRAIDRMNDHPKWFRKELNNILESAALQPQEKVG